MAKKSRSRVAKRLAAALATAAALVWSLPAVAHCGTLDGPVVAAARKALDPGNVNLVLIWVQKKDEAEVRNHFQEIAAGRAFASAYVEYTRYVERLYDAGETLAPGRVRKEAPGLAHSH